MMPRTILNDKSKSSFHLSYTKSACCTRNITSHSESYGTSRPGYTQSPHSQSDIDYCEHSLGTYKSDTSDYYPEKAYSDSHEGMGLSYASHTNCIDRRDTRFESRNLELPYDTYSRKSGSQSENRYRGTFPNSLDSYEKATLNVFPKHSADTPSKVSDIHKLLNHEQKDVKETRNIPISSYNTEYRINRNSIPYPVPPTYAPRHLSPSSHYTTKSYYHPYLGSSQDTYHPRAVSYITSQNHSYHIEYPYMYGNQYMNFMDTKNHSCQYPGCYMRFKRLEHLKRHYRVHTLERPYVCTQEGCEKSFSRRDNLGQHLKTHERRAQKLELQPNTKCCTSIFP
ncbi:hypothetical protein K7432_008383 [Basidiobolus ranarum]|uniref:C2H2-type domain-containing protein n=1 Tax=Basidiobolus ranarum TaxID=34480 RepID=A0ABR2WRZ8_9FUNG